MNHGQRPAAGKRPKVKFNGTTSYQTDFIQKDMGPKD